MDLMSAVHTGPRPVDDVLLHLLEDPRAALPRLSDALFVRVVDVPAALGARTYASDVDVVLEVRDTLRPQSGGTWRVAVPAGGGGPKVTATREQPDVSCDVRELGAVWLGGQTWAAMLDAGLVDERRPGAVQQLSRACRSDVAPFCSHFF